uniref:CNH domain-containing protein n=1 Tax=Macrostomum lignano TaxID=282301 RepID=A0A1I8JPF7_9PLAT
PTTASTRWRSDTTGRRACCFAGCELARTPRCVGPSPAASLSSAGRTRTAGERPLKNSVGGREGKSAELDELARRRREEGLLAYRRLMIALRSQAKADALEAAEAGENSIAQDNGAFSGESDSADVTNFDSMPRHSAAEANAEDPQHHLLHPQLPSITCCIHRSSKFPFANLGLKKSKPNSYEESFGTLPRQIPDNPQPSFETPADEAIYDDATDSGMQAALANRQSESQVEDVYDEATESPQPSAELATGHADEDHYEIPDATDPPAAKAWMTSNNDSRPSRPQQPLPPKPRLPAAAASAAASASAAGGLGEMVTSYQPIDASVRYFYQAYQNPAGQAAEATVKLNQTPRGTFCVVGFTSSKPRKVFLLLVQTGRRVATYQASEGFKVLPSEERHHSMSQLLYHHHIFDLPRPRVALLRPLDGDELFGGAPSGTFAAVSDAATNRLFLYASHNGQLVKLPLERSAGKIWAEPLVKFSSLEELLVHYHQHELELTLNNSQRRMGLRLTTPCQLSEQVERNIKRYLSQQIEEETEELPGCGPAEAAYSSRDQETRPPSPCRTKSSTDLSLEPVKLSNSYQYKGPIDVKSSEYRCFDETFTVRRNPEMTFDSLEKLMLYLVRTAGVAGLSGTRLCGRLLLRNVKRNFGGRFEASRPSNSILRSLQLRHQKRTSDTGATHWPWRGASSSRCMNLFSGSKLFTDDPVGHKQLRLVTRTPRFVDHGPVCSPLSLFHPLLLGPSCCWSVPPRVDCARADLHRRCQLGSLRVYRYGYGTLFASALKPWRPSRTFADQRRTCSSAWSGHRRFLQAEDWPDTPFVNPGAETSDSGSTKWHGELFSKGRLVKAEPGPHIERQHGSLLNSRHSVDATRSGLRSISFRLAAAPAGHTGGSPTTKARMRRPGSCLQWPPRAAARPSMLAHPLDALAPDQGGDAAVARQPACWAADTTTCSLKRHNKLRTPLRLQVARATQAGKKSTAVSSCSKRCIDAWSIDTNSEAFDRRACGRRRRLPRGGGYLGWHGNGRPVGRPRRRRWRRRAAGT